MIKRNTEALDGKKILLLDDDQQRITELTHILESQGVVVYMATSIQSMVQKAMFFKPQLCIVSLALRNSEVFALTELLKANQTTARIPLVYQADIQSLLDAYSGQLGSKDHRFDFITWPYNPTEIVLRLCLVLGNRDDVDDGNDEDQHPCVINEQSGRFDKIIFNAAHNIIRSSLANTPSLNELAKMVGTNTKRLSQTFQRVCNMTVYQYIIEVKMMVAARLLSTTDLDIRYVAIDLGYSTQANFSTAFKHKFGMSPRDYRKNNGGFSVSMNSEVGSPRASDLGVHG